MVLARASTRSLLLLIGFVALALTAIVELGRAPVISIAIIIALPTVAIGLRYRLGLGLMVIDAIPACVVLFVGWAVGISTGSLFLIVILATALICYAFGYMTSGQPRRVVAQGVIYGMLSLSWSLAFAVLCNIVHGLLSGSH
jgi:hypothetical protein